MPERLNIAVIGTGRDTSRCQRALIHAAAVGAEEPLLVQRERVAIRPRMGRIADRGASCSAPEQLVTVEVGGICDVEMRPVSGVH